MSTIEKALEKLKRERQGGEQESTDPLLIQSSGGLQDESHTDDALADKPGEEFPRISETVTSQGKSRRLDLDIDRLTKAGFLTPESGRTQLAEEMRHIKRPLLLNAANREDGNERANLIMVTSSRPSEGKTYTSLNLAMSVAKELDKTVLLIDADVAKPGVTRVLGVEKEKGLVDYLVGDGLSLSDVMLKTNISNFRFIPAGRRHIHSTELLASDTMQRLVQELSDRYPDRVVIFDSPPLLATSEASVLTGLVGQVVMVVEAEKTSRQEVEEAISQIDEDVSVGLVLNKARGSFGTDYYGQYGAYGD